MLARFSRTVGDWWQSLAPRPIIRTGRLLLRDWKLTDWKAVYRYRRDPEVLRYHARTEPYSGRECYAMMLAERQVQERWPRVAYDLAIVLLEQSEVIGEISLAAGPAPGEAYLGFMLHRDHWGKGYATEAGQAFIRFGFETLKLTKIIAGCTPGNVASERVLRKLGMRALGPWANFPGAPEGVDALAFELTYETWSARPAQESP